MTARHKDRARKIDAVGVKHAGADALDDIPDRPAATDHRKGNHAVAYRDGVQVALPEVCDREPLAIVYQREECLEGSDYFAGEDGQPDDVTGMRRTHGSIFERALDDCQRGLPCAHCGFGACLSVNRSGGCRLLLPGLPDRGGSVALRRLGLVELLGRHIALGRERAQPFDSARGEIEVGHRAPHLISRNGRGGALGRQHTPLRFSGLR